MTESEGKNNSKQDNQLDNLNNYPDYDLADGDVGATHLDPIKYWYLKLHCSLSYKRSKITFNFLTKAAVWSIGYTVQMVPFQIH